MYQVFGAIFGDCLGNIKIQLILITLDLIFVLVYLICLIFFSHDLADSL